MPRESPTNDALYAPLNDSVRNGQCVAIIGSGVSQPDYPLWSELLNILCVECGMRPEDARSTDPLDIAQAVRVHDSDKYHSALDSIFSLPESPKSAMRYHCLARIPFNSYITLNFDPLLLHYLHLHANSTISDYPHISNENHGGHELFYVHGRLGPNRSARDTEIVFTRDDFELAYSPDRGRLHGFFQSTLLDHDVCFIGCDPTQPNMRYILQICNNQSSNTHGLSDHHKPRWFILLDEESLKSPDLQDYGLLVVRYPRVSSSFVGLDHVLEYLAGRKPVQLRGPGAGSPFMDATQEPVQ